MMCRPTVLPAVPLLLWRRPPDASGIRSSCTVFHAVGPTGPRFGSRSFPASESSAGHRVREGAARSRLDTWGMVIDTRQTDSAMLGITERRVAQGVLRATPCRPHAYAAPRRAFRQLGVTLKFSGRKLVSSTVVAGLVLAACGGGDGGAAGAARTAGRRGGE